MEQKNEMAVERQYPEGWKNGDICVMITDKKKGYTNEYMIEGYDGRYFELRDRQGNFYRASVARLFRSRSDAMMFLHGNKNLADGLQKTRIYIFSEHGLTVSGEKHDLLMLLEYLEGVEMENTWADLLYKIRLEFDEDFRREVEV